MSDHSRPTPTVFLLLKQGKDGKRKSPKGACVVPKGALLVEIPEAEQGGERAAYQQQFCLLQDPSVTLCCTATDVAPLHGAEYHYLMAVSPPEHRIREFFNEQKMEWVMGLQTGDEVSFQTKEESSIKGKIRYVGHVEKKDGVYFGVEINEDDKCRGRGTTSGQPHFNCGHKNAVWVSMDQLIYGAGSSQSRDHRAPAKDVKTSIESTAPPKSHCKKSLPDILSRTWKHVSSTAHAAVCKEHQSESSFKEGDRVVVHSLLKNFRTFPATVRWTGQVQMSKQVKGAPLVMFAGLELETGTKINPEVHFPETHLDLTGWKDATFKVGRGHTRVFLPEQMLIAEDEYKKQIQQEQLKKRQMTERQMTERTRVEALRGEEDLAEGTGGHHAPSTDPVVGMSEGELKLQHAEMERFKRKKEAKDSQRAQGRWHPTPQGAVPGVSFGAPAGGGQPLDESTGGLHTPQQDAAQTKNIGNDPVVGMSESELQLQLVEMERFKREKEAKDSQRAQSRWHPTPQGAVPGVYFGAPAGGGQPLDESTGGLHIPQEDAGQTRNIGNGAGAFEQQHVPGHALRVEYPAQIQYQISDTGRWEPARHEGGDPFYQNLRGGPPCQYPGVGQQQLGHVGLPSYQHQDSGSRHQTQYSIEHPRNAPHQAFAVPPPPTNTPLEQPLCSPTACPRQSTPAQLQQHQQQSQIPSWLMMDTAVVLKNSNPPISGVVKFIGNMPGINKFIAGLELHLPMVGCTDGIYKGRRYFQCLPERGYFCSITDLQPLDEYFSIGATSGIGGAAPTDPSTAGAVRSFTNPLDRFPEYVDEEQSVDKVDKYKKQEKQDQISSHKLFSFSEHQVHLLQASVKEKDALITKQETSLSQQAERIREVEERLAQEVAELQEVKTSLSQKEMALSWQQQRMSQLEVQLSTVTKLKTQEITHLQQQLATAEQQKTQEVTSLREEVGRLQSMLEQQLRLGSDTDISFWVVSHKEVHSAGRELGAGGWGRVVVGSFRGQEVALKQLHSDIRSPYYNDLLHREVSLMAKVRHPNLLLFIAAVLDSPSKSPIIVTELLDTSLRQAYQSGQLTNNRVKLFIVRDVAAALNYLHLQADIIIHRDVSSSNVLLQALPNNQWRGKLSDFGSANLVQYASTPGPGAAMYTAPEVFKGEKQSSKMDVYSYGKLLCEVFTSQLPDPRAFPSMLQSMAQSWPLMHWLICSCVEQDPTKRPSMTYVVDKLNKFTT